MNDTSFTITAKAARINAGLSTSDAAECLGISVAGYLKKENGQSRFYVDEMDKLSHLFGIPLSNFFETSCSKKKRQEVS